MVICMFIRTFALSCHPKHYITKPTIDIKFIINNLTRYKDSVAKRQLVNGAELIGSLDRLPNDYLQYKESTKRLNHIQKERNQMEKLIAKDPTKRNDWKDKINELKNQYKYENNRNKSMYNDITEQCLSLPNLIDSSVQPAEPQIIQWINKPLSISHNLNHIEIMERKKMLNIKDSATTSGTSSYYLIDKGALLERALCNYTIDLLTNKFGFQFVIPPSLTKIDTIDACGFRPRDMNGEEQIYKTGKDMGLIATSEITLAAMNCNKIMSEPVTKYCGISRCYRAEAGARGRDTKGLYRVHEFTKIEMFCWSKPDMARETLDFVKDIQVEIVQSLGLYGKLLNMPANDLGNSAYQKYDIEVWMPGRGNFGEITSSSNCTDYQARRLNIKFKDINGNAQFMNTINGTAMALPRIILAIVENFYDNDTQLVKLPKVLVPYMNQQEWI